MWKQGGGQSCHTFSRKLQRDERFLLSHSLSFPFSPPLLSFYPNIFSDLINRFRTTSEDIVVSGYPVRMFGVMMWSGCFSLLSSFLSSAVITEVWLVEEVYSNFKLKPACHAWQASLNNILK